MKISTLGYFIWLFKKLENLPELFDVSYSGKTLQIFFTPFSIIAGLLPFLEPEGVFVRKFKIGHVLFAQLIYYYNALNIYISFNLQ
jgi:hypothetical protein